MVEYIVLFELHYEINSGNCQNRQDLITLTNNNKTTQYERKRKSIICFYNSEIEAGFELRAGDEAKFYAQYNLKSFLFFLSNFH